LNTKARRREAFPNPQNIFTPDSPVVPTLLDAVRRYDQRRRAQTLLTWLPRALAIALTLTLVTAIAARLRPLLTAPQLVMIAGIASIAAVAVVIAVAWGRRVAPLVSARRFDLAFALDERVSTALALHAGQISAPQWMMQRQISGAADHAARALVRIRQTMPLPFAVREWGVVLAIGVALALLLILPNPMAEALSRNDALDSAIAAAADELESIAETIAADSTLTTEERRNLLETLRSQIDALAEPDITPEQAFAGLSQTSADLRARADAAGQRAASTRDALQRAADALRAADGQAGDRSQNLDENGSPIAPGEGTLAAALESLQGLGTRGESMSASERAAASEALRQAAVEMRQQGATAGASGASDRAADSLDAAADVFQADPSAAQPSLSNAADAMQQSASESMQQQGEQDSMNRASEAARDAASEISRAGQQQTGDTTQSGGEQGSPQDGSAGQQPGASGETAGQGTEGESEGGQEGSGTTPGEGGGADQQSEGAPSEQSGGSGASQAGDSAGDAGSDSQSSVGQSGAPSGDNDPDGTGERAFEPVNVPRRSIASIPGDNAIELSADAGDQTVQEGDFSDNPDGQVTVPYNQVYNDYRGAADRALDSGTVPLALRDVVRDYFTSLEPGQ